MRSDIAFGITLIGIIIAGMYWENLTLKAIGALISVYGLWQLLR